MGNQKLDTRPIILQLGVLEKAHLNRGMGSGGGSDVGSEALAYCPKVDDQKVSDGCSNNSETGRDIGGERKEMMGGWQEPHRLRQAARNELRKLNAHEMCSTGIEGLRHQERIVLAEEQVLAKSNGLLTKEGKGEHIHVGRGHNHVVFGEHTRNKTVACWQII